MKPYNSTILSHQTAFKTNLTTNRLQQALSVIRKKEKNTSSFFNYEATANKWKNWTAFYSSVQGYEHLRNNLPCQDFSFAHAKSKRPIAIVCDGAGSSKASQIGSRAVVTSLKTLFLTLEPILYKVLDKAEGYTLKYLDAMVIRHVNEVLLDLSIEHNRPIEDFSCTLLLMVGGMINNYWLKIGDGAIVVETFETITKTVVEENKNTSSSFLDTVRTDDRFSYVYLNKPELVQLKEKVVEENVFKLSYLGGNNKGGFANETFFISKKSPYQSGFISAKNISAFFVMSDGCEIKFVDSKDTTKIATRLSTFAEKAREGFFNSIQISKMFYSTEFTSNHNGDDCSLAFCSKDI